MIKPKYIKSIHINSDTFCSIWITNHEGRLKERYQTYLKHPDYVKYMDVDFNVHVTYPGMNFEEFAVFMFDHAAFSIEHNSN
jgi:hypothetical protein